MNPASGTAAPQVAASDVAVSTPEMRFEAAVDSQSHWTLRLIEWVSNLRVDNAAQGASSKKALATAMKIWRPHLPPRVVAVSGTSPGDCCAQTQKVT